jgi:hypothetical protein
VVLGFRTLKERTGEEETLVIVGFEDLELWEQAYKLAIKVYKLAKGFPNDERFRYTDQICRTSTSIPTNVTVGTGQYGKQDFKHILYIACPVQLRSRGDFTGQGDLSKRPNTYCCWVKT